MKLLMILISSGIFLGGCSYFTRPLEQPVIEQRLNQKFLKSASVGTLSLTPERRVVLVNFENKKFCAEAPTEVGADLSRLLKATAEAQKGGELRAGLGAIIAATSGNEVLNRRTQGMQLFLANSYFICQMYLNDAITKMELLNMQLSGLNAVAPLIEKEIEYMYTGSWKGSSVYKPLDVNKILEEILKENGESKENDINSRDTAPEAGDVQ